LSAWPSLPIREALRHRKLSWVDLAVGTGIIVVRYSVVRLGQSMTVNFTPGCTPVTIATDIANVPYYAARSLLRMFIASTFHDSMTAVRHDGWWQGHLTADRRAPVGLPNRVCTRCGWKGLGHKSQLILSREDVIHGKDPQMFAANCSLLSTLEMNDESTRVVPRRLDHANDLPFPQHVSFDSGERMTVQWAGKRPADPGGQQFESTIAAAQRNPSSCWSGPSPTDKIRSTEIALWGAGGCL
jgi:hypothetical protein